MRLRFTAYDSPDGFQDWLWFWYIDEHTGVQIRVAIHAAEFIAKGPPGKAGDLYRMGLIRCVAEGVMDQIQRVDDRRRRRESKK